MEKIYLDGSLRNCSKLVADCNTFLNLLPAIRKVTKVEESKTDVNSF